MFIFIPGAQKLNGSLKKALQKGELSLAEVEAVKQQIEEDRQTKKKGYKRALIMTASVFLVMVALSIPRMRSSTVSLAITLSMGIILGLILLFVKLVYVDGVKRQFERAVSKGYPDLLSKTLD